MGRRRKVRSVGGFDFQSFISSLWGLVYNKFLGAPLNEDTVGSIKAFVHERIAEGCAGRSWWVSVVVDYDYHEGIQAPRPVTVVKIGDGVRMATLHF